MRFRERIEVAPVWLPRRMWYIGGVTVAPYVAAVCLLALWIAAIARILRGPASADKVGDGRRCPICAYDMEGHPDPPEKGLARPALVKGNRLAAAVGRSRGFAHRCPECGHTPASPAEYPLRSERKLAAILTACCLPVVFFLVGLGREIGRLLSALFG